MRDQLKKISARHILFLYLVLALIVLGASDQALLGSEDYFLFLPLCAFAVVLFCSKSFSPRDWLLRENRANALFALLLAALTLLMLPITRFLSGPMFSLEGMQIVWWNYAWQRMLYFAWNWTGLLGAVVLSVFGCWYALFTLCLSPTNEMASPLAIEKPLFCGMYRWTFLIAAVAFVCTDLSTMWLLNWSDSNAIWTDAQTGNWNDMHPVSFLFFVRMCTLLIPSRRIIPCIYLMSWVYTSNMAIGILNERHPKAGKWYAIVSCLMFLPLMYLGTMLKDQAYSIAIIALSLQLLRILSDQGKRGWRWLGAGVWAFCALSFRHDGVIPIVLTAVGLLLFCWKKRRDLLRPFLLTAVSVFAVHFLLTNVLAFGILGAERNPPFTAVGTPMYLLAAVVDSECEMDPQDQALLEKVMPLSDWVVSRRQPHSLYSVDPVSREWGVPGARIHQVDRTLAMQYNWLAVKYLFRCPGVVLRAFFTVHSLAWEITTPPDPDAAPTLIGYDMDTLDDTFNNGAYFLYHATGFSNFSQRYANFLEEMPVLRELLARGGMPMLFLLFAALVLWKKGRRMELLACLPLYGVCISTFFGLCAQETRYLLPLHGYMLFALLYARFVPAVPSAPKEIEKGDLRWSESTHGYR